MSMSGEPNIESPVAFVGPFESYEVHVNERAVPFLLAHPQTGGKVLLMLDRRLGLELTVAEAERVVPFLADVIAVAMGYASFPAADGELYPRPPFPRVTAILGFETEDASEDEG